MNKNKLEIKEVKINHKSYDFYFKKGVFYPTATTQFLLNAFFKFEKNLKNKKILDLGCGSGIITILISKKYNQNLFYASDTSKNAFEATMNNFKLHNLNGKLKKGNLLEPWRKEKFDFIISDVSGISNIIAKKSEWFKSVPCKTGTDGTKLIINVIKKAKNNLNKKGKFYFPIASLSNEKKIILYAKKYFKYCKILSKNEWFLPKYFENRNKLLSKLKLTKKINFKIKFGKFICETKILCLYN